MACGESTWGDVCWWWQFPECLIDVMEGYVVFGQVTVESLGLLGVGAVY